MRKQKVEHVYIPGRFFVLTVSNGLTFDGNDVLVALQTYDDYCEPCLHISRTKGQFSVWINLDDIEDIGLENTFIYQRRKGVYEPKE
jgi:hypothetical protein